MAKRREFESNESDVSEKLDKMIELLKEIATNTDAIYNNLPQE